MRIRFQAQAAYFSDDRTLWLVDPSGDRIGLRASDHDDLTTIEQTVAEWLRGWMEAVCESKPCRSSNA